MCTSRVKVLSFFEESGFSLIEVIVFILIVSLVMGGMVPVFTMAGRLGSDPLVEKQSIAFAQGLLEEIQSHRTCTGTLPPTLASQGLIDRRAVTCAEQYAGYVNSVSTIDGSPIPVIFNNGGSNSVVTGAYSYSGVALTTISGGLSGGSPGPGVTMAMTKITVAVTGPDNQTYSVVGYVPGPG